MTGEVEWCQVQSSTPGKGEQATPIAHLITSSRMGTSTGKSSQMHCEQSREGDRAYYWN